MLAIECILYSVYTRKQYRGIEELICAYLSHHRFDPLVKTCHGLYVYQIFWLYNFDRTKYMKIMLSRIRQKQGMRALLKIKRPDLPVLPKEIWRDIYKRKYLEELCDEKSSRSNLSYNYYDPRLELCNFAKEFLGVPDFIILQWQNQLASNYEGESLKKVYLVSTIEIKSTLSKLLRTGKQF